MMKEEIDIKKGERNMDKFKRMMVAMLIMLIAGTAAAYDFVDNGIYYKILSVSERTAEVTYQEGEYTPTASYKGALTVPATVTYNGKTFNVVAIGEHAFNGCTELTNITLPEGLLRIEASAFCDCNNLEDVTIPRTVTKLADDAFGGCNAFKHVVIPPSVTYIGDRTFFCEGVETITIEDGETGINAGGYWGRAFAFPNVVEAYIGRNCGGWQAPTSLIDHWFMNGALRRVEFGPNVTEIPYCMLYGDAYNLTELILSPNIKRLDTGALSGCYALKFLELPDGLEEIGDGAFGGGWNEKDLALTDLVIGSKIKSIGDGAFAGCRNLQNVTIRRKDAINIPENAFPALAYLNATLYVPEGSKETAMQLVYIDTYVRQDIGMSEEEWKEICREMWAFQGYPDDYYSDTLDVYEPKEVPGYSVTDYWKNFSTITEGEPAGIKQPNLSTLRMIPFSQGVVIQGLKRGSTIAVYTLDGKLVNKRKASATMERIDLPSGRVYVVTAEGRSIKVRM
jgi:hypothetical protein